MYILAGEEGPIYNVSLDPIIQLYIVYKYNYNKYNICENQRLLGQGACHQL